LGCEILDAKCRMADAGCLDDWMLDAGLQVVVGRSSKVSIDEIFMGFVRRMDRRG